MPLLFSNTFTRIFFLLAPIIDEVLFKLILRFPALFLITGLLLMATCIFVVRITFFITSFRMGIGLTRRGWSFLLLGNFVKLALFCGRLTRALNLEAGKIRCRLHSYVDLGLLRFQFTEDGVCKRTVKVTRVFFHLVSLILL